MLDALKSLLERIAGQPDFLVDSEEGTCQEMVLPVLASLAWDRDNVQEVVPQFRVGNGRIDYCLRIGEKQAAFIEVKKVREDLEAHQEQLLRYAFDPHFPDGPSFRPWQSAELPQMAF